MICRRVSRSTWLVGSSRTRTSGHRHLQLLSFSVREALEAPRHVVLDGEGIPQRLRLPAVVRREIEEPFRRAVRPLLAQDAEQPARDGPDVGRYLPADHLRERGLPAAVVAQKAAPAAGEGYRDIVQDGIRDAGIGVAHMGEHDLHRAFLRTESGAGQPAY